MSTSEVLREVRPQQHVGTFEPSTELLEKYRRILASSPPTSPLQSKRTSFSHSFFLSNPTNLPFQPEQRRSSSKYLSFPSPTSERKNVRAVKETTAKPRAAVIKRSISPSLPYLIHPNIVDPLDILQDGSGEYAVTFTSMSTLESLMSGSHRLGVNEADCYFKQAALGILYLHNSGVAHQNLRPENFVLTLNGVLKIANFDSAEIFTPLRQNKDQTQKTVSIRSRQRWTSAEYIAPEVFVESSFDPRPVDMWALGVVYMEMRTGRLLWNFAAEGADESYDRYLAERNGLWGYRPIENMSDEHCRRVINSLLDPVPKTRYTAARVLRSTWYREIELSSFVMNESP